MISMLGMQRVKPMAVVQGTPSRFGSQKTDPSVSPETPVYQRPGGLEALLSHRSQVIPESRIRGITREAAKFQDVINLGQGTPDGDMPPEVKLAALQALAETKNDKYAHSWGLKEFRDAIAERYTKTLGFARPIDPETEVVVTHGTASAMENTLKALVDPGDEVILFSPAYENYAPNVVMAGGTPKFVQLKPPNWSFDPEELKAAFSPKTKAIVVNTPGNPSGKVFSRAELSMIARECKARNVAAISDEIYEHMVFDKAKHVSIASLPGMRERTIVMQGLSKSYNATGWRVGFVIAPPVLMNKIRLMFDYSNMSVAAPFQKAGAVAMRLPESHYRGVARLYQEKRDILLKALDKVGFKTFKPQGAYFVLADSKDICQKLGLPDGVALKDFMLKHIGVAAVPMASLFSDPETGRYMMRFSFCKDKATLKAAGERLKKLIPMLAGQKPD